jgi:hypothetical protein
MSLKEQPVATALSRAVALRFDPNSIVVGGSGLQLQVNPNATATARTIEGAAPVLANATAFGLGAGYSKYYEGLPGPDLFNTSNLFIQSGGGLIQGHANADARSDAVGDQTATALASNIGLANLSYLDRVGASLLVGTAANRFTASATASNFSALGSPNSAPTPTSNLTADAVVRGVEGGGSKLALTTSILGEPVANVGADATLNLDAPGHKLNASAKADALGLDRAEIKAVPLGSGNNAAQIGGDALSSLNLVGGTTAAVEKLDLSSTAIGLDHSLIFGAPTLNTTVSGGGLATIQGQPLNGLMLDPASTKLSDLKGIGIASSQIFSGRGNDSILASGGFANAQGYGMAAGHQADAAGIDASVIATGMGNDLLFGTVLNEVEANEDANGDGILQSAVFLDRSAKNAGALAGFDGIRNSSFDGGLGNDIVRGSSNGSAFEGAMGNDSIDLDRARNSSLWGGMDNDLLRVNGASENISYWGSLGNDTLKAGNGSGNQLDGGLGIDISEGGSGSDTFLLGDGAASLTATSNEETNSALLSDNYWKSLSQAQKQALWSSGQVQSATGSLIGGVDTINNFQVGAGGDVLQLNSALASMTDDLWKSQGSILAVDNKGGLSVQEGTAGSNRIGVVVGTLADILKMGMGAPSIAYASDTHQLMYDADGDWRKGSISMGTLNIAGNGSLSKANISFGGTTGGGLGTPSSAVKL